MQRSYRFKILVAGLGFAFLLLSLAPAEASSANISHSYQTEQTIPNGSLVSLDPQRSDYVQLSNTNNAPRLLGVAVNSSDSLIAVDATPGTTQVATTGNANMLVSTLNGDISVGDELAVSPFNGVGMKALAGSRVIGLAQTAFNEHSTGATNRQVTDKSGKSTSVAIGYVNVSIAVGTNNTASANNLSSLQKIAKNVTGHVVSTPRVILSVAVATVTIFALITLIYASIYGSIISIGRNPLAKYAVFRTLGSVLGLAALMSVLSLGIIFLLLR